MRKQCWCGNNALLPWNEFYARCPKCETLVDVTSGAADYVTDVHDDGGALYDETYWLEKMSAIYAGMGCSGIDDIILLHYRERAAYWVRHILPYLPFGSRVFEMGCGLGTLTRWLSDLGYDALASELSPRWRAFLRKKLGISVFSPGEAEQAAGEKPFDAIIVMDVLEHLPEPHEELKKLSGMLSEDGILVLQVPEYAPGQAYSELLKQNRVFSSMLLPGEYLFLYSWAAVRRMLGKAGFVHVQRFSPIFPTDMFLIASRKSLQEMSEDAVKETFMGRPGTVTSFAALHNAVILARQGKAYSDELRRIQSPVRAMAEERAPSLPPERENMRERRGPVEHSAVKRLLYVRLDGIGDGIIAGSLLEAMPQIFPNASIMVVCDTPAAAMYEAAPAVSGVVTLDKKKLGDEAYREEAVRLLRACGADAAFNGTISPTAPVRALLTDIGIPLISTAVDATNMRKENVPIFEYALAERIPLLSGSGMDIERCKDMLSYFGVYPPEVSPKMWVTDADIAKADECFRRCGFSPEKTVALFAGGGVPQKGYAGYGQALAAFCLESGYSVAALGGPGDSAINEINVAVLKGCGVRAVNLCGTGSLTADAAFLKRCILAVGADTAMAHMACAFGMPLVVLVPGANFGRFLPYNNTTTTICLPLDCYGCNWNCPYPAAHCIAGIEPETVRQAVEYTSAQAPGNHRKTLFMQRPAIWPKKEGFPLWRSPAEFISTYKSKGAGGLDVVLSR